MKEDPNQARNLTIVVIAGLALGVGFMVWLMNNADTLREMVR